MRLFGHGVFDCLSRNAKNRSGKDEKLQQQRIRFCKWLQLITSIGDRFVPSDDGNESPETMLADVEKTMAANVRMLARSGHLNRKDSPGIRHGKSLMLRVKKEAEINYGNDPDSRLGLGSFGMKAPVLEHFRRISDPDTDYRLALQRGASRGCGGEEGIISVTNCPSIWRERNATFPYPSFEL